MSAQHPTKQSLVRFVSALAVLCGTLLGASGVDAQERTPIDLTPAATDDDKTEEGESLRRPLLIIGAALFVGSYAPTLAFATLGDWEADDALVIPVAGPWMALANPENEPLSRALLINSGVLQGVGALSMVMSLALPRYSRSTTLRFGKNEVRVTPTQLSGDAYGMGAAGRF